MGHVIPKNADGKRVPSVTGVLKQLGWSTSPLMWWANQEGLDGRVLYGADSTASKAADVGTVVHAYCEADIKGEEFSLDALEGLDKEQHEQCTRAIKAWHEWREQSLLEPVASECTLVSEMHQYGGTLDAAMVFRKLSIIDIKTSKGLYPDVLCQVRAYGHLWHECKGEEVGEYHVIRLGKTDGSFHHHSWPADGPTMRAAWEAFEYCLRLKQIERTLKGAT